MEDHNNPEPEPEIEDESEIINNITTETIEPIILPLPISISQLMSGMVLGTGMGPNFVNHSNNLEERIQHQSFYDRNKYKKVCGDFINSLSVQKQHKKW